MALSSPHGPGDTEHRPEVAHGSVRLLDVRVDTLRLSQLLRTVGQAARDGRRLVVYYVNVQCMNVRAADSAYAAILERADLVYCDGTGVRVGARAVGLSIPERMTGADWIHDLCHLCIRHDLTLFLLGGLPGSASAAAHALQCRHPGLRIVGALPGYHAGVESVCAINHSGADILLVGMGTPRQEKWLAEFGAQLDPPVLWAVGALFDFASGRIPRGPRWMTEHGLEWVCRLAAEPRKLWRRYLFGNPAFLWRLIRHYWLPF